MCDLCYGMSSGYKWRRKHPVNFSRIILLTRINLYECRLSLIPYYTIFHVTAVGIPLPANFNKQNGAHIDDGDPVSSGDSEIHSDCATKLLASERVADTAVQTGIMWLFHVFPSLCLSGI